MPHFSCLVFTRREDSKYEIENLMKPYRKSIEAGSPYAQCVPDDEHIGEVRWTNPKGYWNDYIIGGKWAGRLLNLKKDYCTIAPANSCKFVKLPNDEIPNAFLTDSGEWTASVFMTQTGRMVSTNELQKRLKKKLNAYWPIAAKEGMYVTVVDCFV